jgi:DnaJ-class molecular chaperone
VAEDPYKVLGVAKTASQDDIRKAYRKLAKELHPDLNPGNAKAAERFKEISAAYDIVGDAEKRARYDKGEIDASGAERPEQRFYREYANADGGGRYHTRAGFEDFEDVSDIFADLFRRGGQGQGPGQGGRTIRMKGADVHYRLEVEFLDAARSAKKRITLPTGEAIDLTIPEGVTDGQVLRMKEKGGPGLGGGPAGDALIEIAVRPHPTFTRAGDDVMIELPISLDEAILGGKVEAPTISGSVSLTIPAGASSGQMLRLRGKGIKKGDQLVRLKIVMPAVVDDQLKQFMTEWRKTHAYDPRDKVRA